MRGRGYWLLLTLGSALLGPAAARDLQPFDSSELLLNALQLGVGHPPGQPAYALPAALLVRLFPAGAAFSLSLFSAAASLGCALIVLRLASRLSGGRGACSSALAIAALWLVPGVWDLSTRPEVYQLASALLLGGLGLVVARGARQSGASLLVAGGLTGLGAAVHPALALPLMLAALVGVLVFAPSPRRGLAWSMVLGLGVLCGCLPYLYLPWAGGHADGALVWGAPLRGDDLAHYLLGRDYRSWGLSPLEYMLNLGRAFVWLADQWLLPWAIVGAVGFALTPLPRLLRLLPLVLTTFAIATIAANHPFVPDNPDYAGYLLPSLWLDAVGAALLVSLLVDRWHRRVSRLMGVSAVASSAAILLVLFSARAVAAWPVARSPSATRTVAERVLGEVPPRGLLLLESDYLVFPCLVLQQQGVRRDVTVLNLGWASSSWYWQHLAALDPELPRPLPPTPLEVAGMPRREARVAALLFKMIDRPLAAESLRLASLAGGRSCRAGWLALGRCSSAEEKRGGGQWRLELAALSERHAGADSLDARVLVRFALDRAEEAILERDRAGAWAILRAGLSPSLRAQLPADLPPERVAAATPVRAEGPQALASPDRLLLRLRDLLMP